MVERCHLVIEVVKLNASKRCVAKSAFLHHFAFAIERTKPVPALSQI
jgi:hypothetical protein